MIDRVARSIELRERTGDSRTIQPVGRNADIPSSTCTAESLARVVRGFL